MGQILSILWEMLSILWEICYVIVTFRNHSSPPPSTTILERFSGKKFLTTWAQSEKVGQISFRPPNFFLPVRPWLQYFSGPYINYIFKMQRYVTRYAYAFCYQRVLCAYCNQEIRSVNDTLVYLKSQSEKLFPLTRRCFQLLLTVRPITIGI